MNLKFYYNGVSCWSIITNSERNKEIALAIVRLISRLRVAGRLASFCNIFAICSGGNGIN